MKLGLERLRRIMDDEQRGMVITGPAERIAEVAYRQGARDMRERCAKFCDTVAMLDNDNALAGCCAEGIRALKDEVSE